ncbi:MAG TPA: YciI family protein, partial [Actinomycetes bacterium]|nr:YciI family protein [Actinomycetes bacterium]
TSQGKRVAIDADGNATVIDGPFAETKELIAGYAIWEVASMDEAVEWVKRSPVRGSVVELRKILDVDDFADSFPAELAAAEKRMREESATKQ